MNNPCAHKCQDTGVAVECSCHPGYELAADERSCNGKFCYTLYRDPVHLLCRSITVINLSCRVL
jgi:hypothetical protein